MSKLKAKSIKLKVWIIIVLLLMPAGSLGFSTEDRNAVLNDAVFYDPNENNAVSGLGGCISPLLPSINDQAGFAEAIDKYIEDNRPNSPFVGMGNVFVEAGIAHGINPAWVVNVARKESIFGTAGNNTLRAFNAFGRTASASQPSIGRWYRYDSFRGSIDPHTEYLKRRYIDEGLTTFETIIPVYAPASDGNDPDGYIADMKEWVGEVTALAGAALSCDSGDEETDGPNGSITYPPNMGSRNAQGYYQMPEATSGEYVFYEKTCTKERLGKKELLGVLYTVAVKWKQANPSNLLKIGDLNANTTEHNTHKYGIGVDLYTQNGSANNVDNANYSRSKAVELGKILLDTGKVGDIWFHDQQVIDTLKAYALEKNLPYNNMRIEYVTDRPTNAHKNHYHLNINSPRGQTAPWAERC